MTGKIGLDLDSIQKAAEVVVALLQTRNAGDSWSETVRARLGYLRDLITGADDAINWTVNPRTGAPNSSKDFLRMVEAVNQIIRNSGGLLIQGHTKSVAATIVAQLAHKHGLAPR